MPADLTNAIIDYENGELTHDQIVELFQQLIDTGMAWRLQGSYGRTTRDLIDSGDCHIPTHREAAV